MVEFVKKYIDIILLSILLISFSVLIGYKPFLTLTYKVIQPISKPDKMYIYVEGERLEVEKESPFFSKIVSKTNSRLSSGISTAKDIVDNNVVDKLKKNSLGIEFIYNQEQSLSISGDGFRPFNYYKIFFALINSEQGTQQGSVIYSMKYGNKENYIDSSRGPLSDPNEVIRLVNEYKQKR